VARCSKCLIGKERSGNQLKGKRKKKLYRTKRDISKIAKFPGLLFAFRKKL
jgi:hypothetical protein